MASVKVAVEGCCHGELNNIYASITSRPVAQWPDILMICGDFQSLRNNKDLDSLAVPDKYKRLGDFRDYYSGVKKAPVLTIFVGGNHEASNYLHGISNGGWVAQNIYYLGHSNVVWYKGLRIGAISGIYKDFDFYKPYFETLPLDHKTKRSIYHQRFEDFLKLKMIRNLNLNCFISHDWPEGVTSHGDLKGLLKRKPFFKSDIETKQLGSVPTRKLLYSLMPNYWFSAHLHVKFEAIIKHKLKTQKRKQVAKLSKDSKKVKLNHEEINLNLSDDSGESDTKESREFETDINSEEIDLSDIDAQPPVEIPIPVERNFAKGFSKTNFLALDKCLPRRKFIEFLEIPITNEDHESNKNDTLYFDEEFLRIKKWFSTFQKSEAYQNLQMNDITDEFVDQFGSDIDNITINTDDLKIHNNFVATEDNTQIQTKEYETRFGI